MLVHGVNTVKDLINNNPEQIVVVFANEDKHEDVIQLAKDNNIKVQNVSQQMLDKNQKLNHQNIFAEIRDVRIWSLSELIDDAADKDKYTVVMLDSIMDPQNLGAIIRTSVAFGVDAIIYPKNNSTSLNSTAVKASVGTWTKIKICESESLNSAIPKLQENHFWVTSTSLEGDSDFDYRKLSNSKNVIIAGNEGKGIKPSILKKSDFNIKIDIESTDSLNVGVSTGIILHELYKVNK